MINLEEPNTTVTDWESWDGHQGGCSVDEDRAIEAAKEFLRKAPAGTAVTIRRMGTDFQGNRRVLRILAIADTDGAGNIHWEDLR